MIEIDNKVSPLSNSAVPCFLFTARIELYTYEIIYEISGSLYSEDNTYLGTVRLANELLPNFPNTTYPIGARFFDQSNQQYQHQIFQLYLVSELNEKSLKYIETLRYKNLKNDVIINIKIRFSILEHSLTVGKYEYKELLNGNSHENFIVKSSGYSNHNDLYMLNSSDYKIGSVHICNKNFTFRIPYSDWINDFYHVFHIGEIILIEAPVKSNNPMTKNTEIENSEYKILLKRAVSISEDLENMKELISDGNWAGVMEKSRSIIELLIKEGGKQTLRALLIEDTSIEDSAVNNLLEAIDKIYQYSSSFHHAFDKTKEVKIVSHPNKEDAELIYYLCIGLYNIVTSKLKRIT